MNKQQSFARKVIEYISESLDIQNLPNGFIDELFSKYTMEQIEDMKPSELSIYITIYKRDKHL